MALLNVLVYPDTRLKIRSDTTEKIDSQTLRQLDDMLETMYHLDGVGLAATQVAINKRLVVMDVAAWGESPEPIKLVNPEITWVSAETQTVDDGCLSVPGYWAKTQRPARIRYQYSTEKNKLIHKEASGLEAACIHHEIDHLNGILFIDRLSPLKRKMLLKKYEKNTQRNFLK